MRGSRGLAEPLRRSQHIAPGRCAMGCSTCPLTGRTSGSTTGNPRRPGSGHRLSTERRVQRFAEAPDSRSPACAVTPPQSGHPTPTTSNEPQNGEEAGQGVCRATCSWRAEMTIMHGRSQPGAVSPTRTERKCVSGPQRPASPGAGCSADQSAALVSNLARCRPASSPARRVARFPLLAHQVQLAAARGIVTRCWPGPATSPRCAGLWPTGIGAAIGSKPPTRLPPRPAPWRGSLAYGSAPSP